MTAARQVRAIAGLTLLEALRGSLLWLVALILLAGLGLAELLGALAITETRQTQAALLGAVLRHVRPVLCSATLWRHCSLFAPFKPGPGMLARRPPAPRG